VFQHSAFNYVPETLFVVSHLSGEFNAIAASVSRYYRRQTRLFTIHVELFLPENECVVIHELQERCGFPGVSIFA
jgi:hypothetical protein